MQLNNNEKTQSFTNWYVKNNLELSSSENLFVELHGLSFQFCFSDQELKRLILEHLPAQAYSHSSHSKKSILVRWHSTQQLGFEWDQGGDPLCKLDFLDDCKMITQRDFVALHKNENEIVLVSDNTLDDGFFNFLRYIVPTELLASEKYIFHSSGVINPNNEAILFLGHSGHGKTTICEKFSKDFITGDDMHVVSFSENQFWIETTHLGQTVTAWDKFENRYPLKSIYWLQKNPGSTHPEYSEITEKDQRLKVLGSLSGLLWEELDAIQFQNILLFAQKLIQRHPIELLKTSLESQVSRDIFNRF